MRFVVFYKINDMSVSLYANYGTESDGAEFIKRVSYKLKHMDESNSTSDSKSTSECESNSDSNCLSYKSYIFLDKIFVCKIVTGLNTLHEFKRLLEYLVKFYYIYED